MNNEVLPIGTIVEILGSPKVKFLITGYFPIKDDGSVKDYVAVAYPIGCVDNKSFFAFDSSQIEKIVFMGYSDVLFEIYKKHYLSEN